MFRYYVRDKGLSFHFDKFEHHRKKKSKEEFEELCNDYKIEIGKKLNFDFFE